MPVDIEPPLTKESAVKEAEEIVKKAQISHDGPPPPEPPDNRYRRERPEKPTWGWLNSLGVALVAGGFLEFWRSTGGVQAGIWYATMVAGVVLIENRRHQN